MSHLKAFSLTSHSRRMDVSVARNLRGRRPWKGSRPGSDGGESPMLDVPDFPRFEAPKRFPLAWFLPVATYSAPTSPSRRPRLLGSPDSVPPLERPRPTPTLTRPDPLSRLSSPSPLLVSPSLLLFFLVAMGCGSSKDARKEAEYEIAVTERKAEEKKAVER